MTSGQAGAALSLADVKKRFGAREALRGLSLAVPRGSCFGLIGPNGAGKTTAFSVACGFLAPDAGRVDILGGVGFDPTRLKGRLSALPQDAVLGRETRCIEHLMYFARLQGLDERGARGAAERILDDVGLGDRRRARAKTLSHGMLRRLAVAQALLGDPELVLLDEPTSGLDPRHAHELRELLRRARGSNRTVVISSHNLPELESLCDEVGFIDRGVLVAGGATDAITGRGHEIEIELGAGPVPIAGVEAALAAAGRGEAGARAAVTWQAERRLLRVVFTPAPGWEAEDVIGLALGALLSGGARVSGVRRGSTLEKKFLELG
jgi:ABC-type multidrug transport system ATPase subunit